MKLKYKRVVMDFHSDINRFGVYVTNLLEKKVTTNDIQHNHVIGLDFIVGTCPYCLKFGNSLDKQTCKYKQ